MSGRSAEAFSLRRLGGVFFSRLGRASALMFAGSIVGGVLGYVYQALMGRMLSTSDYGVFSAIMALFAVLSAPFATLLLVVARRVSDYRARHDDASIAHFYRSISLQMAVAAAVMLAVAVLFAPQLQAYMKSTDALPIYLLGVMLFVSFHPTVNDGFLQGLQNFPWLSTSTTLRVILRIVFSAVLVSAGYRISGAIGGTILALVAGWLVTMWPLRCVLRRAGAAAAEKPHLTLRPVMPVLMANTAFAAMTQLDIVLVNYYFPPHEAGLYAAASVLGKAVMYLPGGIAMALFPMVAENNARDRGSGHLLAQAVTLTAALCGAGAVFYLLFGEWLIALLYGEDFRAAGQVLKYFGFAILPMALVMVAEYFLIANGKVLFAYLFVVTAPLQVLAFFLWHDSLRVVVAIVAASGAVLASVGYGMLWRALRTGGGARLAP